MVTHILVGIDGSEHGRRAAHQARDLARQTGAHLTLLVAVMPPSAVVLPPFDAVSLRGPQPSPDQLAAAQALIDALEADLGHAQATSQVTLGPPAETILAEAARLGADLIVVGARGLNAAERLLLGSVSEHLARHADRPVMIVP